MGVNGLMSYMERQEKQHGTRYQVAIKNIIRQNRVEGNGRPVFLVDSMNTLMHVYGHLDYINGGQLIEFRESLVGMVRKFEAAGARLVFFFDGPMDPRKRETWKRRRSSNLPTLLKLLDRLEDGRARARGLGLWNMVCLPVGYKEVAIHVLKHDCNCEVHVGVDECDETMVVYAKRNKCLAIISDDSDFVIYGATKYQLSMKHMNMTTMTTYAYDRLALARSLNIDVSLLPLLASVMGNDVISYDKLQAFRNILKNESGFPLERAAAFIRHVRIEKDLPRIAQQIFGDRSQSSLLEDSISRYVLSSWDIGVNPTVDSGWTQIMARAKRMCTEGELHHTAYQILSQSMYSCALDYEDCRKDDMPLYSVALKDLRRKLYGILLYEKRPGPGKVEELIMAHPKSFDAMVEVEPLFPAKDLHPGLLVLWDGVGEDVQEKRWKLIGDVLKLNEQRLKTIRSMELRLVLPALALIYIIDVTKNGCLKEWEINAFLAMVLTIKNYNIQELQRLPSDPVDMRAIRLFTLISRTMILISVILNVISRTPVLLTMDKYCYVTDGKLYRQKYWMAKQGSRELKLCEESGPTLEQFKKVRNFIMDAALIPS